MSIKRYNVMSYSLDADGVSGPFVKYEDYAESERYGRQADITIENLKRKVAQLAAENVEMKEALWWLYETVSSDGVSIPDEKYSSVTNAAQVLSETPATDSFLAEVRAQGVEMMVEQCELDVGFIEPEDEEHYTLMIEHAKEFAAQLRQEVRHEHSN